MSSARNDQQPSFTRRISNLFDRRYASMRDSETRATTTFEVPLFLSPSRYEPPVAERYQESPRQTRSPSSTRSLIDDTAPTFNPTQPLSVQASSVYSSPPRSRADIHEPIPPSLHQASHISSEESVRTSSTRPSTSKHTTRKTRRKRRPSLRKRIQSAARIGFAFGVTLFLTLIAYLVLAVTGTATGLMFHILIILFILALLAVFLHSVISLFLMRRQLRKRKLNPSHHRAWNGRDIEIRHQGPTGWTHPHDEVEDEFHPEKPIRVTTMDDEEHLLGFSKGGPTAIRIPPPIYGNFRESKRIDPNLVHVQEVPISPLTPTYDEAMSDVSRVVGYQPPHYAASEARVSSIVASYQREAAASMSNIHPLERGRITESRRGYI